MGLGALRADAGSAGQFGLQRRSADVEMAEVIVM